MSLTIQRPNLRSVAWGFSSSGDYLWPPPRQRSIVPLLENNRFELLHQFCWTKMFCCVVEGIVKVLSNNVENKNKRKIKSKWLLLLISVNIFYNVKLSSFSSRWLISSEVAHAFENFGQKTFFPPRCIVDIRENLPSRNSTHLADQSQGLCCTSSFFRFALQSFC